MDMKAKHNLASAYMAAWHAVKGTHDRVVVNPEPHGWFEISGYRAACASRPSLVACLH
jgi:hypothetical protein